MQEAEFSIDFVDEIYRTQEECLRSREKLRGLLTPRMDDYSALPGIYAEFLSTLNLNPNVPLSVYNRKKFLLIVLSLYSPGALAGGRLAPGLRRELARLLNLGCGTPISDNVPTLLFCYRHYRDFRRDVCEAYAAIGKSLCQSVRRTR